jgi:hypothetical protein
MLKEIPKSDIVVRPFKVYKEWTLDETDVTPIIGQRIVDSLFDEDTDPKSNGLYKRLVFDSIKSQFYTNPFPTPQFDAFGDVIVTDSEKSILSDVFITDDDGNILAYDTGEFVIADNPYNQIWVLPIPQQYYGEGVKPGSLVLVDEVNGITYTDDGNKNLISSLDSSINGNIFYDKGLIVMDDVDEPNNELGRFTLTYRSTMTIYENEIFLSVNENEFNVSQNPTAVHEVGGGKFRILANRTDVPLSSNEFYTSSFYRYGSRYIKNSEYPYISSYDGVTKGSFDDYELKGTNDQTGSYLAPFITTIGLYDNAGDMVAVAKLPKPIKSLPDYPVNFIVRFDT